MVGFVGKVIKAFNDIRGSITARTVKSEIYSGEIINALLFAPSGDDSPPLPEDAGFFVRDNSLNGRALLGVIDRKNTPAAGPGERRLYARDQDGNIVSFVWIKADGILELNGNADFAVRFNELKTAFDQLKTDLNNFISVYDTHTHGGVTVGAGATSPPGASGTPSSADIDPAKVEEVKLP